MATKAYLDVAAMLDAEECRQALIASQDRAAELEDQLARKDAIIAARDAQLTFSENKVKELRSAAERAEKFFAPVRKAARQVIGAGEAALEGLEAALEAEEKQQ